MSPDRWLGFGLSALAGALSGLLTILVARRTDPPALRRVNVGGRRVSALLGFGILVGSIAGVFAFVGSASTGEAGAPEFTGRPAAPAVVLAIVAVTFVGGLFDDLRGDEAARGFRGHLAALRAGRITGGAVKILAGGLAGAVAALPLADTIHRIEAFLLVALTANLFNLLDRAPGRAAKVALVLVVPLVAAGSAAWAVAAAGLIGALVIATIFDLSEKGMLGDAGANPIGAVVGLGLAMSLGEPFRALAVVGMIALNALSERVSFSNLIDETPWLRGLDRIGRK